MALKNKIRTFSFSNCWKNKNIEPEQNFAVWFLNKKNGVGWVGVELMYKLRTHIQYLNLTKLSCVHRRLMFPWKVDKNKHESNLQRTNFHSCRRLKSNLWLNKYLGACSFIAPHYRASWPASHVEDTCTCNYFFYYKVQILHVTNWESFTL